MSLIEATTDEYVPLVSWHVRENTTWLPRTYLTGAVSIRSGENAAFSLRHTECAGYFSLRFPPDK